MLEDGIFRSTTVGTTDHALVYVVSQICYQ